MRSFDDPGFWRSVVADIRDGTYSNDAAQARFGDSATRLRDAMAGLPKITSFQDAAIASRAMIRARHESGEDPTRELALLYWLAAVNSYPESDEERREVLGGEGLYDLSFTYDKLGFERLDLLTKTDTTWLLDNAGEPSAHVTLKELAAVTDSEPRSAVSDDPAVFHARRAASTAGEAARQTAKAVSETARETREEVERLREGGERTVQSARHDLDTARARSRAADDWIQRRLGNAFKSGSDEWRFVNRANQAIAGLGAAIVVLLLVAVVV